MSAQNFSVRFKLATKTAAEWKNIESTIKPLKGEICFYSDLKKAKLGIYDEVNNVTGTEALLENLPFLWLNEEEVEALIKALRDETEKSIEIINGILDTKVPNTRKVNGHTLENDITLTPADVKAIPETDKGKAGGVATLDANGYVPSSQLPSYVDDMLEGYYNIDGDKLFYKDSKFENVIPAESGKIYVDLSTTEHKAYRWAGDTAKYVEVFKSVTLGETDATAYAGNKGKEVTDKVNSILDGNHADEIVTYTNEMATVNALGGIAAGTTFSDMPITELLTKLLYPYIKPVVTTKSSPNGGVFELGTTVDVTNIEVNVTKKSENITRVEVFDIDGTTSLGVKTDGATGKLNFPIEVSVSATNKKFTAKVTDASGTVVSASTGVFTFVSPYYYGAMNAGDTFDHTTMNKLVEAKANKAKAITANNQCMVFAYPSSYGVLSQILDPNGFKLIDGWTCSSITINGVSYYLYVSNEPVTVENYTITFQY